MSLHPARTRVVGLAAVGAVALLGLGTLAGCGSDSDGSSGTTTTSASSSSSTVGGDVLPPVILTPDETSTTVDVGQVVTFDMGDPGEGSYVAVSDDEEVFRVDNEGKVEGTYTTNAGGTAVGAGTAKVSVSFRGAQNGVGTPTEFTITVR